MFIIPDHIIIIKHVTYAHTCFDEDETDLKIRQLCGSSIHHGGALCRLREPNLHVAIVEYGMVGSHEYIAQDPTTASPHS